jgi:hypothetical protein
MCYVDRWNEDPERIAYDENKINNFGIDDASSPELTTLRPFMVAMHAFVAQPACLSTVHALNWHSTNDNREIKIGSDHDRALRWRVQKNRPRI